MTTAVPASIRAGAQPSRRAGRAQALRSSLALWACWLWPLIAGALLFRYAIANHFFGYDFQATIYEPGRAILQGRSPYPAPTLAALIGRPTFVYPPLILWLDVPVALMPLAAAKVVWTVLLVAGVAAALRVLEVRDWRCYGLALGSVPVLDGLVMGNVTILFTLGLALAWRFRDRRVAGGMVVGLLIALKLLLWPLLVWLFATRRVRSAATAVAAGAVSVMASWALIGFDGLAGYSKMLHIVSSKTAGPRAFSISALVDALGVPGSPGVLLQRACGVALLGFAFVVARGAGGDRRAFSAVIAAALVISPVVWLHYFALLLVPLALAAPGLRRVWAIPALFWGIIFLPGHAVFVASGMQAGAQVGIAPSLGRLLLAISLLSATFAVTAVPHRVNRPLDLRPGWTRPSASG